MDENKDNLKNPSKDEPKMLLFTLQSNATKAFDLYRMMGNPAKESTESAPSDTPGTQEGD